MSQEVSPTTLYTKPTGKARLYLPTGQVAGEVIGDTLVKIVRSSIHMLRKPLAWAMDTALLVQAGAIGAIRVQLHDRDTGDIYYAPLDAFWIHGVGINRGYGDQIALPLKYWRVETPSEPKQYPLWGSS